MAYFLRLLLSKSRHFGLVILDSFQSSSFVSFNACRCLGKVALGMQLYSMGFSGDPVLSLSSEVSKIFEDMMDEHGDTLALQYAGSQLVHSIKTYKKTAAFQVKMILITTEIQSSAF